PDRSARRGSSWSYCSWSVLLPVERVALSEDKRRNLGREVESSDDRVFGQAFVSCFLHVLTKQVERCAKHECLRAQGTLDRGAPGVAGLPGVAGCASADQPVRQRDA